MNELGRLRDVLFDDVPPQAPPSLRAEIKRAARRVQPRPRWLALIKEPPMRLSHRVAVGSPPARLAYLTIVSVLTATLAAGSVVIGASLLPSPSPETVACTDVVCPVAPLAEGREWHTATLLADGTVLVVGGAAWGNDVLQTAERWDPATEKFRPAGSLAEGREGHTATLLPDGRILVTGGGAHPDQAGNDVLLNTAELWDPKTETFGPTGSMAVGRGGHGAALLPDGRVLVVSGQGDPTDGTDTTEIWDPVSGTFSAGPTLDAAGWSFAVVGLDDGRVLIARGSRSDPGLTSELFDPTTNSFSPTGPVTGIGDYSIGEFRATLLKDGRVLVVGGSGSLDATFAQVWDPDTETFAPTGSPVESYSFWQRDTLLDDGRVFFTSGTGEVWDPATGTFGMVGPASPGIAQQTATLLQDGRVLVVGGFVPGSALASAAIWDLEGVGGVPASPAP